MRISKTAIIWGQDDLLSQAMEIFLRAEQTWEVIRIPIEKGINHLIEQAKRIGPDVIILYAGNCIHDISLPVQLIREQSNLRIIIVNLKDNQVQLYSTYSLIVRDVSDLLSIIENGHLSDHPA
jgi:hypothetical protein